MDTDKTKSGEQQLPPGHQSPGTPPGQTTYKPVEPKRRAEDGSSAPEPSASPKRDPQHEPGYEAKQAKEAEKRDPASRRPQAHDDDPPQKADPQPRHKAARAKAHVKRSKPIRKHK